MAEAIVDGNGAGFYAAVDSSNRLKVAGDFSTGSEIVIVAGSVQTYDPQGVGSVFVTNPETIGSYAIQTIAPTGYSTPQIIRNSVGSPSSFFVFSSVSESFLLDNIGSNPIYYSFDSAVNPANSGTGLMLGKESISADIQIGSISVQSSGTSVSEVNIISIRR